MAIKDVDIKDMLARIEVKMIGTKILAIPRGKEEKFFNIELNLEEGDIDEIVGAELDLWTE